jgi:hypothetical protein
MKKEFKAIPKFDDEDQEREFWATHDSTDYIDWDSATLNPSFPNLKRTENLIELFLPESLSKELTDAAKKISMTKEELARKILSDGLQKWDSH